MPKLIKVQIVLFDESELLWFAPTEDRKAAGVLLKSARWIEIDDEFYNTDYILKWKVLD